MEKSEKKTTRFQVVFTTGQEADFVEGRLHTIFERFLHQKITGEADYGEELDQFFIENLFEELADIPDGIDELGQIAEVEISVGTLGDSTPAYSYADLEKANQAGCEKLMKKFWEFYQEILKKEHGYASFNHFKRSFRAIEELKKEREDGAD